MKTFEELGVSPEIRKAIEEMGYENPMPVQEEVIPYLLGENNDVVALAQTGTGKTAAFGLPLLQQIDVKNRVPQSLILCPTRELCLQIAGDLNDYSKYIDGLKVLPVYGGSSIDSQIRSLKRGVHIIVSYTGTTARPDGAQNRIFIDRSQHSDGRSGRNAEYGIHRQHQRYPCRCPQRTEHLALLGNHEP